MIRKFAFSFPVYNTIWILIILIQIAFLVQSIKKLFGVSREIKHTVKPLKVIYWTLVILFHSTNLPRLLLGWTSSLRISNPFRFISEYMAFLNGILSVVILLTSIYAIKIVIKFCENQKNQKINWSQYKKSVVCLSFINIFGLVWPIFYTFLFVARGYSSFKKENTLNYNNLQFRIYQGKYYDLCQKILTAQGHIAFFATCWLLKIMVDIVIKLCKLLKYYEIPKEVQKYKIREWRIYVILLIVNSLISIYITLSTMAFAFKWDDSIFTFWIAHFLKQKIPLVLENNPNAEYRVVSLSDILFMSIFILDGITFTLLVPFRQVRRTSYVIT